MLTNVALERTEISRQSYTSKRIFSRNRKICDVE